MNLAIGGTWGGAIGAALFEYWGLCAALTLISIGLWTIRKERQ